MKIVFFGTPTIAAEVLQSLISAETNICLVVTKPDKPKGRSGTPQPPPVKIVADKYQIPFLQPELISTEENARLIGSLKPDLFVVVAYGEILKKNILDLPKFGSINLHASLLPKYRGASPVQRAIIDGEKETGVSIIRLVQKMDAGPILLQKTIPITERMNVVDLFNQVAKVGKEALLETIQRIDKGLIQEEVQDESKVTFAAKLTKEDEILNFNQTAKQLDCRIKGVYPYAYFNIELRGQPIKLFCLDSQVTNQPLQPKEVYQSKNRLIIGTNEGSLEILKLKQEGRKELTAEEWLRSSYNNLGLLHNPKFEIQPS